MYSNKQLKVLLQSKKKRATALKNQSNKRVSTNNKMDKQIITENIKNTKAMNGGNLKSIIEAYKQDMKEIGYEIQNARDENRTDELKHLENEKVRLRTKIARLNRKNNMSGGSCCGGMVGRKRNSVMVGNNTQKIFSGVYDARNPKNSHTPINLRGGAYSLPVGDIISDEQHRGIVEAQQKYANAWRRRNQYVKF